MQTNGAALGTAVQVGSSEKCCQEVCIVNPVWHSKSLPSKSALRHKYNPLRLPTEEGENLPLFPLRMIRVLPCELGGFPEKHQWSWSVMFKAVISQILKFECHLTSFVFTHDFICTMYKLHWSAILDWKLTTRIKHNIRSGLLCQTTDLSYFWLMLFFFCFIEGSISLYSTCGCM